MQNSVALNVPHYEQAIWTMNMGNEYFLAQDQAGTTHTVYVNRHHGVDRDAAEHCQATQATSRYELDDGSQVKRIDNDTFQIAGTGALITLVRD